MGSENEQDAHATDFFISHAREDRDAVALPLYRELTDRGHKVWLDTAELTLGDSLRAKLDEGLRCCRFGIVVLSPSFFAKNWPQYELDGLMTRQMNGAKVILPVWHQVDQQAVAGFSPSLAGWVAVMSTTGIGNVADEVERALRQAEAATLTDGAAKETQALDEPLWEYRLFYDEMARGFAQLEPKYEVFELGLVHPSGPRLDLETLGATLSAEMDIVSRRVENIGRLFSADVTERAFGPRGVPGDRARIVSLSRQFTQVYDDVLDSCDRLRRLNVAEAHVPLLEAHVQLVGSILPQFREYVRRWYDVVLDMPSLIARAEAGEEIVIDLSLVLDVDQRYTNRIAAETKRLRRGR